MKPFIFEELPEVVTMLCNKVNVLERRIGERKDKALIMRCGSSLNKSDLAHFFYVLMDEELLFFDAIDKSNNRTKFQLFIEQYFTYSGDLAVQTPINTISKEFSEAKGFTYREKHIRFLDKIIQLFQERRQRIVSR